MAKKGKNKPKSSKKTGPKRRKSATVKGKSNPGKSVAKKKNSSHKSKKKSKLESFLKGGFGGAGVGETVGFGLEAVGAPAEIAIPTRIGTSAVGGYYIGDKKLEGLIGGVVFELIPTLISLFTGGNRASRLSGL